MHNIDKEGYLLLWELRYRIQIRSIKLVPLPAKVRLVPGNKRQDMEHTSTDLRKHLPHFPFSRIVPSARSCFFFVFKFTEANQQRSALTRRAHSCQHRTGRSPRSRWGTYWGRRCCTHPTARWCSEHTSPRCHLCP